MATIPDTPINGQRLSNIPNVSMGPRLGADAFGGNTAAEAGRFGQAVQQAGQSLAFHGIDLYEEMAQNEFREGILLYNNDTDRYSNQVRTNTTGNSAWKTADDIEQYSNGRAGEISSAFTSQRAKELFDKERQGIDARNQMMTERFIIDETAKARVATLKARNKQQENNVAAHPGATQSALEQVRENNAQLHRGSSPEVLEQANRVSTLAVLKTGAESMFNQYGPVAAMKYLDEGFVKNQFKNDEDYKSSLHALKTTFQQKATESLKVQFTNDAANDAVERVTRGEKRSDVYRDYLKDYGLEVATKVKGAMDTFSNYIDEETKDERETAKEVERERKATEKEAEKERKTEAKEAEKERQAQEKKSQDTAIRRWSQNLHDIGLNQEQAATVIDKLAPQVFDTAMKAYDEAVTRDKATKATEALQRTQALDDEFEKSGYQATSMPSYENMTAEEKIKYSKRADAVNPQEKFKPNLSRYMKLYSMPIEQLADRWSYPSIRDADYEAMGKEWGNSIVKRVNEAAEGKGSGKPDEYGTFETMAAEIQRNAKMAWDGLGRDRASKRGKEAYEKHETEVLDLCNDMVRDYLNTHKLTNAKQIPLDDRNMIISKANLTFKIKVPGRLWGENTETVTAAEAYQRGIDVSGAVIDSSGLDPRLRGNHTDGAYIQPMLSKDGREILVDINVPFQKAPASIQKMARAIQVNEGRMPTITRMLDGGGWVIFGQNVATRATASGEKPVTSTLTDAEKTRIATLKEQARKHELMYGVSYDWGSLQQ